MSDNDPTTPTTEYLTILQNSQALIDRALSSTELFLAGGVEAVQYAALAQPQTILDAIAGLASVLKHENEEKKAVVEAWLSSIDHTEQIGRMIEDIVARTK